MMVTSYLADNNINHLIYNKPYIFFLFNSFMNKKAEEETTILPWTIAGIVFAIILILALSSGIYKIFNAVFPSSHQSLVKEDNFNEFIEKINLKLKENKDFSYEDNLIVSNPNIVFGLNTKNNLNLPDLREEGLFSSTSRFVELVLRPNECIQGFSCICQCKAQYSRTNMKCQENIKCLRLQNIKEVLEYNGQNSIIYYGDNFEDFKKINIKEGPFFVYPNKQSNIPLIITKQKEKLIFSYNP